MSPEVGQLDHSALEELAGASPDEVASLLADLSNATDPKLRAAARRAAANLYIRMARTVGPTRRGVRRLDPTSDLRSGDLDLDTSFARTDGLMGLRAEDLVARRWNGTERAFCLLIDRSGSMHGDAVARACVAAASVLFAAGERADCSVVAFARDSIVLQAQGRRRPIEGVIGDICSLRGKGVTDLSLALLTARRQLATASGRHRTVILLSDGKATEGADPNLALNGIDRLHVLCPTDDAEAIQVTSALARRGRGRSQVATSVIAVPRAVMALLEE